MGRPRHQCPNVLKTTGQRPRWYIRVKLDVLVGPNQTARREQCIYLGWCSEMGKRAAEKLRDEKLREINNTPLVVQSQVLFADLAKAYCTTYLPGLAATTRHNYAHRLEKHVLPAFGKLRLHEIDPLRVQQWVYEMERAGLSRETRRTTLAVLRSVFEVAQDWGYFVGRNPATKTRIGGDAAGRTWNKRALEPEEARRLLTAISNDEPLRTIVEVALFTGLRASEILALTWGCIDVRRGLIEIKQAKSQHGHIGRPKSAAGRRHVELGALAGRLVRPLMAADSALIFHGADYFTLQWKLRRFAAAAGIAFLGFGFHTFRRTHATWRSELGLAARPDAALVRDMGHATPGMTERYIQGTPMGIVKQLRSLVGVERQERTLVQ